MNEEPIKVVFEGTDDIQEIEVDYKDHIYTVEIESLNYETGNDSYTDEFGLVKFPDYYNLTEWQYNLVLNENLDPVVDDKLKDEITNYVEHLIFTGKIELLFSDGWIESMRESQF